MPDSRVSAGLADYEDQLGLEGGREGAALWGGGAHSRGTLELAVPQQPQGSGASALTHLLPRLSAGKGFLWGGGSF